MLCGDKVKVISGERSQTSDRDMKCAELSASHGFIKRLCVREAD